MIRPKAKKWRTRLIVAGVMTAAAALAESPTEPPEGVEVNQNERNKWRISVGPAFNFNLKSRIGFKSGAAVSVMSQYSVPKSSSGSRQAALDRITGASDPEGVKRYEGGAWINPHDSAHSDTRTWNFAVPSAANFIHDGQMTLRSASYSESTGSSSSSVVAGGGTVSDEVNTPGVNLEVSRELYYNEDWKFGVDLSLGFSWFMRNDCFDGGGEIYRRKDSSTTTTGHFNETFDVSRMRDPDGNYPFQNGVLGNGTFAGPGPVLDLSTGRISEVIDGVSSRSTIHSVGAYTHGDYNEFEFIAALRPFYEPWEWMRIYGTLGVGLSYMRLSYSESMTYNGVTAWSASHVENNWDVYGVAGLGGQFKYKQFLLGFDFMARLWASDVEIETELLRGTISRSPWMFRCYVGFEF